MKVLVVTNMYPDASRPYNGIFVAEQLAAIRRFHPDVCFDICYIDGGKGKAEYLKSVIYVNRRIRYGSYDLVHIHFGLSGIYLLSPFRKAVPTIVTFHGSDIQPAGGNGCITVGISRHTARTADMCITLNACMDALARQCNGNTLIVPCAVDTGVFKPVACKGKSERDRKLVVFPCSRDMAVKDYPLFDRVLGVLRREYGIDCEEKVLSGLSRRQVAELLNVADILLLTSKSEGSPQAVKEALACNLPVVSTPVGDVAELLEGVRDCYVSHTRQAGELAALAAKALLHNGSGMAGRERIMQLHLDEKSIADRIYDIYEQSIH